MRRLAIVVLTLGLALASFCPTLAQEPPPPSQLLVTPTGPLQVVPVSPPTPPTGEAEPPTLVPGPMTLMCGYIPCLAICAPVCMYVDLSLYNMAIYTASQEETALRSMVACMTSPCNCCFGGGLV
jgi:hypothetical protein